MRRGLITGLVLLASLALAATVSQANVEEAQGNPVAFMKRVLEISTFDATPAVLERNFETKKHPNLDEATRAKLDSVKSKRTAGQLKEALELASELIRDIVASMESNRTNSFNLQKLVGQLQYERILVLKQQFEFQEALRETRKYASLCLDLEICSPALANKLIDTVKTDPSQRGSLEEILRQRRAKLEPQ